MLSVWSCIAIENIYNIYIVLIFVQYKYFLTVNRIQYTTKETRLDLPHDKPFIRGNSNGNNLMTYASKLKVDRGIPGEPILYLSGK